MPPTMPLSPTTASSLVRWLTGSHPLRSTDVSGSNTGLSGLRGTSIRTLNVNALIPGVKVINNIIHDTSGVGGPRFKNAIDGESYGNIIYNNGRLGPDRGHGHAFYWQNKTGTKRIVDNIAFHQFAMGFSIYGNSAAPLVGFHIEGNIMFNEGAAAGVGHRGHGNLIGGGTPVDRVTLDKNFFYANPNTSKAGAILSHTIGTNKTRSQSTFPACSTSVRPIRFTTFTSYSAAPSSAASMTEDPFLCPCEM